MNKAQAREIIQAKKRELEDRLVILGHHYQNDDVLVWADYIGDSLELARKASRIDRADFIVFCGVYFMAESASILAPDKSVYIPDPHAGCPLADMAGQEDVLKAWEHVTKAGGSVMPVAYVNSSASVKAFCGRHGGIICTSGNAVEVLRWAFERSEKVFFVPDMNLGRNTAARLGIPDDEIVLWNPEKERGGLHENDLARARIILWKGWCPVHWPRFAPEDVEALRKRFPGIKVIVHPESDPATVKASDASGSTAVILNYIKAMPPGEHLAVGTEANMVNRASRLNPDVRIMPLREVYCGDMARITVLNLADTLLHLGDETYRVTVPADIARDAAAALENMLRIQP